MRIALTHAYSWPEVRRGAERIIYELSRALAAGGHTVTVYTAGRHPGVQRTGGVTTVRLRQLAPAGARHEMLFGLALVPRLAKARFDAVHALGPRDAVAAIRAARLGRCGRSVYTNLGIPWRAWWEPRPDGRAHERVVREVDVYGCMSRFGLRILEEEYGRDGVLTPGGVNTDELMPAPARASQPTILFSGALDEPHKGVARLLRAAAVVRRRHPGLRVWLSGPGDATALIAGAPAEVRDAVDALPIGGSGDQAERYGRAWVTALPSYGDSFGMAILESLACGTPVVAGNDAALPELVSPGVTGVLCDPGSDDSVAEALVQALDISSRPGTTAACRASAERFDWKNLAADFSRLYAAGSER